MPELPFHRTFQCFVHGLEYDYRSHIGKLVMAEISCTDMKGCIEVFKTIDPDVRQIQTIQYGSDGNHRRDTVYTCVDGKWVAGVPA